MLGELCGREFLVDQIHYKNMKTDLASYSPLNEPLVEQLLVKFLHFVKNTPQIRKFSFPLRYSPHLIPILEKYVSVFFNSRGSADDSLGDRAKQSVHFFSFVLFLVKVYPYSQPHHLKNDLMILRGLVQERLDHYNDFLNRSHIGL